MTQELQIISNLLKFYLEESSPILSGNMVREILNAEIVEINDHEITFCINAPFYDLKKWKETGAIVPAPAPKKWSSFTDYAMWVNDSGAFGTHNASMHWVNRVCDMVARLVPNAEVNNKLEVS